MPNQLLQIVAILLFVLCFTEPTAESHNLRASSDALMKVEVVDYGPPPDPIADEIQQLRDRLVDLSDDDDRMKIRISQRIDRLRHRAINSSVMIVHGIVMEPESGRLWGQKLEMPPSMQNVRRGVEAGTILRIIVRPAKRDGMWIVTPESIRVIHATQPPEWPDDRHVVRPWEAPSPELTELSGIRINHDRQANVLWGRARSEVTVPIVNEGARDIEIARFTIDIIDRAGRLIDRRRTFVCDLRAGRKTTITVHTTREMANATSFNVGVTHVEYATD